VVLAHSNQTLTGITIRRCWNAPENHGQLPNDSTLVLIGVGALGQFWLGYSPTNAVQIVATGI